MENLLQYNSQTKHGDESHLVALVMLTNPTLIPEDPFRSLVQPRQDHIVRFCQRLLAQSRSELPTTITYARIVTLLLQRILSLQDNTDFLPASRQLMILTLDCIFRLQKHDGSEIIKLTTEILEALTAYCSICRRKGDLVGVNEVLEKYFQRIIPSQSYTIT